MVTGPWSRYLFFSLGEHLKLFGYIDPRAGEFEEQAQVMLTLFKSYTSMGSVFSGLEMGANSAIIIYLLYIISYPLR